jgi:hypothetical protein
LNAFESQLRLAARQHACCGHREREGGGERESERERERERARAMWECVWTDRDRQTDRQTERERERDGGNVYGVTQVSRRKDAKLKQTTAIFTAYCTVSVAVIRLHDTT